MPVDFFCRWCYYNIDKLFMKGADIMYCYYSKLRKPDMTLEDIVKKLEVSQNDIATAVSISKSAVNQYINEYCNNQKKLDDIYRYLNSREFYCGYSFMPTKEFSKFLFEKVLCRFEDTMKQNEIADKLRISPQKLTKLKSCIFEKGKKQKLDVYEQYYILCAVYMMCEDPDGYVEEKYRPLRRFLREHLDPYHTPFLNTNFSCLLRDVDNAGYGKMLRRILWKYGIVKSDDYNRALHDDEFIMDISVRKTIVKQLYEDIFFEKDMPRSLVEAKKAIFEPEDMELLDEFGDLDSTPLCGNSEMLCRVILDHYHAFFDGSDDNADMKADIIKMYCDFSREEKEAVCKETADRLSEYAQTTDTLPLRHEFDSQGRLEYSSKNTICCRELSDISDIIQIVDNIGPLEVLNKNTAHVRYRDKFPFENRNYFLELISDGEHHREKDIIEMKLQFDVLDWNFWWLMTQAIYMGRSLDDIYEYVTLVKDQKKSKNTRAH